MASFKLADNVTVLTDFADGYTVYDARYALTGHTHAYSDHGALSGLGDDDHTQYVLRSILTTNGDIFTRTAGAVARLAVGSANQLLGVSGGLPAWLAQTYVDHGSISGLGDDDHTQYALLAGRSGGQSLVGGTASGNDLTLQSTAHGTKGHILFGTSGYDEVNNRLGIGLTAPRTSIQTNGPVSFNSVTVGNLSMHQVESLANNGVAAAASTSVPTAMIFIIDNGGSMAIYQLQGGVHATTELVDASGNYTTVAGTAGKYNIYWSGANGRYEIENKSGSTRSFRMLEFYS